MYSNRRVRCTETDFQDLWLYLRSKALDPAFDLISLLHSTSSTEWTVNFIVPKSTYILFSGTCGFSQYET
jgi:hypothetical protein